MTFFFICHVYVQIIMPSLFYYPDSLIYIYVIKELYYIRGHLTTINWIRAKIIKSEGIRASRCRRPDVSNYLKILELRWIKANCFLDPWKRATKAL